MIMYKTVVYETVRAFPATLGAMQSRSIEQDYTSNS